MLGGGVAESSNVVVSVVGGSFVDSGSTLVTVESGLFTGADTVASFAALGVPVSSEVLLGDLGASWCDINRGVVPLSWVWKSSRCWCRIFSTTRLHIPWASFDLVKVRPVPSFMDSSTVDVSGPKNTGLSTNNILAGATLHTQEYAVMQTFVKFEPMLFGV